MSARPLLSVRDLWWAPPAGAPVLRGTTFDLAEGRLAALIGPSGCGKSTLGHLIAGFERARAGEVVLDGRAIDGPGAERLMVFQESALWPWMTVLDNVTFGPIARGTLTRTAAEREARALLAEFGLGAFAERFPGQLSGGMKRRVDLAQALINQPRLLILDEPFRGLDVMTRELMREHFLERFEDRGQTTLFITSDVEEAVFLGDEVLLMDEEGRIAERFDVALPRPRRATVTDQPDFQACQLRLLVALEAVQRPAA